MLKFYCIVLLGFCIWVHAYSRDKVDSGRIGFTTIQKLDTNGDPLLISIWYPAEKGTTKMNLRDYIIANKLTTDISDTNPITNFKNILELPFLYHLDKVPDTDFEKILSTPFDAFENAPVKKGKFPLLIATATPDSYVEIFEFLARHNFIIASITTKWKDEKNDSLLYVQATNVLEKLLNFMVQQPFVDTSRIAAFGHGGGIQPAFYLAMRTSQVRLLINLDGGVFGLRSKTTFSPDYNPSKLKIPMLHIVTQSQAKEDESTEFNALSNRRYRVIINSDSVHHHDFTVWGRVVAEGLHKRGESTALVEQVFSDVQKIILYFLVNNGLDSSIVNKDLFRYKKF